jgi:ATP-dependent exoDNAse (exonuclease V) alpha subunit
MQLPLQNAFALTVHKTQGLTLSKITISFNTGIFAYDHTYTALNRARQWENIDIIDIYLEAFKANPEAIAEYYRLQTIYNTVINKGSRY